MPAGASPRDIILQTINSQRRWLLLPVDFLGGGGRRRHKKTALEEVASCFSYAERWRGKAPADPGCPVAQVSKNTNCTPVLPAQGEIGDSSAADCPSLPSQASPPLCVFPLNTSIAWPDEPPESHDYIVHLFRFLLKAAMGYIYANCIRIAILSERCFNLSPCPIFPDAHHMVSRP